MRHPASSSLRALMPLVGVLSGALLVTGLPGPVEAQPLVTATPSTSPTPQQEDTMTRPDAVSAMSTARVTGHRVEDLSQRTETVRVFANPDGTWTSDGTTEPERVRDDQGNWHQIDNSLVTIDGEIAPAYSASDLRLSDGGDKVFASITDDRGERLEFHWPMVLQKPVLDGDTATYRDALPGVGDLVVTATATGFTHNLLIPQRPDPSDGPVDLTIPVTTRGGDLVKNPGGEVAVETRAGDTLVAAARPLMWDSSKNAGGDPQVAPVDTTVGQTEAGTPTMTLSPDDAFLQNPDTVYPVTVDPSFTINPSGDTWVQYPNYTSSQSASDELKVGTYDGGAHKARTFMRFDNGDAKWTGVHVTHAELKLRNFYSGSCTGGAIRASRIIEDWTVSGLTWGNQPSVGADKYDDYSKAMGYNSSCPTGDATFDLTAMVQGWHDGFPNRGLRLKAVDETSIYTWRRYRSNNYDSTGVRPRLTVDYNSYPEKPGAPSVSPGNTGYASSTTPTFRATVSDPDKGTVRGFFEVYKVGASSPLWSGNSSFVSSGSTATVTVPSGKLLDGTTYTVKVKGDDGTDTSKTYSSSTTFAVDINKPNLTTQDITSSVFTDGQWHADPTASNTFTFNGPSDTKSFTYTQDGVTQPVKSANSSGDATISWLPKDGWHTLTVTATDKAGNSGAKATFSFGYGLASFISTNAAARSTGVFPIQLASRPDANNATLSWRYAGTTTWHQADDVTKNGAAWTGAVANSADGTQSMTGPLLWDATAQVEDPTAADPKTIAAPALLELRTCFNYATSPTQICSSALPVQLVPNAFGGTFPTTTIGPAEVALATGEMTFTEPDAVDSTAGVARTFSSFDASTVQSGPFGPGWSTFLVADGDASAELLDHRDQDGTFVLVTAGNASQTFTLEPSTGLYKPVGTDDGSRLSVDANTATLTRPQTSTTSWQLQDGAWVIDTAVGTDDKNATPTAEMASDKPGYPTWIAQTAPGSSPTCTETEQAEGCRGLKINYTGDLEHLESRRVSTIELLTHDDSSTVASYHYNADNQLESACGPDPDGVEGDLTSLCATYTYKTVSGRTLVETATSPGQATWTFTYDNEGRLATVGRPLDKDTNSAGGPATWTVRYDLTPGTVGLPDMSAASIARWGQEAIPTKVYAVFDPSDPDTTDFSYADLYYTDEADKTTNTAVHGNVDGVSQWLVNTNWYDENDNVVQALDGAGRAQALAADTLENQQATAVAASSFTVYNQRDTTEASPGQDGTAPASTADGVRVQDLYGPVHTVALKDGTTGPFRSHTAYVYDDQDTSLGGVAAKPQLDQGQTSFNLVVEERHSASDAEMTNDFDTILIQYDYDPVAPGDGNGWKLGSPTRTRVQLADGSWSTSVTRLDGDGRQVETRQPGGATAGDGSGSDAHATVMSYYAKGAPDPDCDTDANTERAAWVGLLCKSGPAGQPTGPSMPVTYQQAYDADLRPTTVVETSGSTTRTTTALYDQLGRVTTTTVSDGTDTRTSTTTYDPATGAPTGQSNASGTVTTKLDTWGRPASYTDASGMVSTTTYTADGQVATRGDGLGIYSYTYDTADGEHRRLPGRVDVGLAAGTPDTFGLTYNARGAQSTVSYPNGITASHGYDETGVPTSLNYTDGAGATVLSFANTVDVNGRVLVAGSNASDQDFTYDALGRLTKVEDTRDGSCLTRAYGFSASSERTTFTSYDADVDGNCQTATSAVSETSTYDSANRIRNTGYTYDDLGRTLTVPVADTALGAAGPLTATYQVNDMIKSLTQIVEDGNGGTVTRETSYELDPVGRIDTITNKTAGAETDRLRYRFSDTSDAPSSIQTSTDSGTTWTTTRYVGVPGLGMAGSVADGAVTWQLANLHGDIVAMQATASGIDSYNETDEYGNTRDTETGNANTNRYGWLGSQQRSTDSVGGLVLMGARVYNPSTGLFLSPDPVQDGGANRYAYPTDPINMADLTGQWWTPWGGIKNAVGKAIDIFKSIASAATRGGRYLWDHSYGGAKFLLENTWAGRVFKVCSWIGWSIGAACGLIKAAAYLRTSQWIRGAAELLVVIGSFGVARALEPLAKQVRSGILTNGSKLWEGIAKQLGNYVKYVHSMSFGQVWGAIVDRYL